MPTSRLTALQLEVLREFFREAAGFFLTGGAALAGFHLGHRETHDLDLFTTRDNLEEGAAVLERTADRLGASIEAVRTSPDFRRYLVHKGVDAVVVDLVRDTVPQVHGEKPAIDGVPVDPAAEIFANKLCALLSRTELRDLVDVLALEATGLRLEDGIAAATRKDAGMTPAQLAWVLSRTRIGDDAAPPGGMSASQLQRLLDDLIARLAKLSHP